MDEECDSGESAEEVASARDKYDTDENSVQEETCPEIPAAMNRGSDIADVGIEARGDLLGNLE